MSEHIFHDYLKAREHLNYVIDQIVDIRSKIAAYPPGLLQCHTNGKYSKWFLDHQGMHRYLPKKDRVFAETMAEKTFLDAQLQDYLQQKKALENYLKTFQNYHFKEESLLSNRHFLSLIPSLKPKSTELDAWAKESFDSNPLHPENLIYKSISGKLLRSKSEAFIDQTLYLHAIPYRYECALLLGGINYYPDFTIRHPDTGVFKYWEHFGLMDDPTYAANACKKIQLYSNHGIILGIDLIATFETRAHPFDASDAEWIVRHYFLE